MQLELLHCRYTIVKAAANSWKLNWNFTISTNTIHRPWLQLHRSWLRILATTEVFIITKKYFIFELTIHIVKLEHNEYTKSWAHI